MDAHKRNAGGMISTRPIPVRSNFLKRMAAVQAQIDTLGRSGLATRDQLEHRQELVKQLADLNELFLR